MKWNPQVPLVASLRWWAIGSMLPLCLALAGCGSQQGEPAEGARYDLAIINARIVDGTGAPGYDGTVLIRDGTFAAVTHGEPPAYVADRVIDAHGRVLAPGFIDLHGHGDPLESSFENFIAMGATSIVLGLDGWNPSKRPLDEWMGALESQGAMTNVLALAGHGDIRRAAGVGDEEGALTQDQHAAMADVLSGWFGLGIHGMSTGLEYVPGVSADPAEVRALGAVVKSHDGILMSHMRSEDDDKIHDAILELVSHNPDGRVHVSHLKIIYGKGAERGHALLDFIAGLQARGIRISGDVYPYTAGYTWIGIVFPTWALPPVDYAGVVRGRGRELREHLQDRVTLRGGPESILFGTAPYAGKTLGQVARDKGVATADVLMELGPAGASAAHFTMDPPLQDALVESHSTAISTDGGPGVVHPRGAGTYAKLIEQYVVETGALSLEQAVHKASGLPAAILQLQDRGTIAVGHHADAVLFDPESVRELATYVEPFLLAEGFDYVLVNGVIVREEGNLLETQAGRLIRPSRTSATGRE